MRMRGRNKIVRWLLALWLMMSCEVAFAYQQATPPAAWRTTPTLSSQTTPAYHFRTTSSCAPVVGTTSYTSEVYTPGSSAPSSSPRRARKAWDDEPDDDEIAVVNTPVGEPLILLIFAMLYIFWNLFAYSKKKQ